MRDERCEKRRRGTRGEGKEGMAGRGGGDLMGKQVKTRLMLGKDAHGVAYKGTMDTISRVMREGRGRSEEGVQAGGGGMDGGGGGGRVADEVGSGGRSG
eukprot:237863-Hanusia_phi.AAC.1